MIDGKILGQKEAERTLFLERKDCSGLLTYCPTQETFEEKILPAFEKLYTKLYDEDGYDKGYRFVVIEDLPNIYIITQYTMRYSNDVLLVKIEMEDITRMEKVYMGFEYTGLSYECYWCNYSQIQTTQPQTFTITNRYTIALELVGYKGKNRNFIWIISDIIKEDEDEDVEITFTENNSGTTLIATCSRKPTSPIIINCYVIGCGLVYSLLYPHG